MNFKSRTSRDDGKKYYEQLDESEKIKIAIEYKSQKWQPPSYFLDWKLYKGNITINGVEESMPINELESYDPIIVCNDKNLYTGFKKFTERSETGKKLDAILDKHPNAVLLQRERSVIDIVYPLVSEFLKNNGFKSTYLELLEDEYKFAIVKLIDILTALKRR